MTTQYTSILKLALPVQGELSGTWGDVVNDNITSMVEEAIAGRAVINTWTTNSHTLTSANGTTSESRCAMLEFTDTGTALTGDATVICPTAAKIYICKNDAGQKVTIKTSAGTGVAIADGQTMFVFCDGTNVVEAVTSMSSLKLGTAVTSIEVTSILDEDDLVSDSATALATQQSIKAYVDAQVTAQDLDFGGDSGTGSVDLDSQTFTIAGTSNEIETSASGQTLTVGLPAAVTVTTSVTTPTVQTTNLNANDGTSAVTIADTTGQTTITDAVLTTADINGGTADNVVIGGTTAAAGSFTTVGATGNITSQGQVITDTINEQTATSGVTVDGVLLKDGGATLTSDLTVDTNTLYVDSTNNRVGIGTSSPTRLLDVNGEAKFSGLIRTRAGSATAASVGLDDDNTGLFQAGTNQIGFTVNGSEAMRIDSSGNVGIGTTNPVEPFTVGATTTAAGFSLNSTTTQVFLRYNNYFSGTSQVSDATKGSASISIGRSSDGIITFSTAAAGAGTPSEVMRITNSGNVGIGINNPQDFNGGANNLVVGTGSGSQGISIYAGASSNSSVFFVDGDSGTAEYRGQINYRHDVDDMSFHTAGGFERMRIDSSGNVGIGTTNPSGTLNVFTGGIGLRIDANAASGDAEINLAPKNASSGICNVSIVAESEENGLASALYFKTRTSGGTNTERMRIDSSGNVSIGEFAPETWSLGKALHVGNAENALWGEGDYAFHMMQNAYYNSGWKYVHTDEANRFALEDGKFIWATAASGTADAAISFSERMRLTNDGNLGIGTSSPAQKLHVNGGQLQVTNGGTDVYLNSSATNSYVYTSSTPFDIYTAGSQRVRVGSTGNVGIGTTSPGVRLDVNGSSGIIGRIQSTAGDAQFNMVTPNANDAIIAFGDASTYRASIAVNTSDAITFQTSSSLTERMRIDSSGSVGFKIVPNDWFSNRAAIQLGSSVGAISASNGMEYGMNFYVDSASAIDRYSQNGYAFKIHADAGNDGVKFSTGGNNTSGAGATLSWSERMRLSNSGHFGIGSTSANDTSEGAGLQVRKYINRVQYYSPAGSYAGSFGYTDNTNNKMWISVDSNYNQGSAVSAGLFLSAWHGDANGSTIGWTFKNNRSDQSLVWSRVTSATSVGTSANEAEFMRMTSGGSLAIGTNTPRTDVKLAVYNDGANSFIHTNPNSFNGTYKSGLRMSSSVISASLYYQGEIAFVGTNNYSGDMTFSVAQSGTTNPVVEMMRLNSALRLCLRTTSDTVGAKACTFALEQNIRSGYAIGVNAVRNTNDSGGILIKNGDTQGTHYAVMFYNTSNSSVGNITTSNTGTTYNTSSDYRLKENVVGLTGATERLKQLEPKRFNFISNADTTVDGFLAHEVSDIVPEAVTGEKDATQTVGNITDENGVVTEYNVTQPSSLEEGSSWTETGTEPVYQGIDQSKLVPLLVATIKELEARITALENA